MGKPSVFTMMESVDGRTIHIQGPDELHLDIENDDVCKDQWPAAERVLDILNAHWTPA